jgi:H+/Cl- antiporter ClcA
MGAAVGMAAVFGAASNAPIALSIMAVELVGIAVAPHVAVVCAIAYALVGKRSIYPSQRAVVGDARVRLKELRSPERSKQA